MDREVKWTASAWTDLEQIAQYIGKDSEHYADRGRQVPEFGDPAVRQLIVGKYRLVYHVSTQMIFCLQLSPLPEWA